MPYYFNPKTAELIFADPAGALLIMHPIVMEAVDSETVAKSAGGGRPKKVKEDAPAAYKPKRKYKKRVKAYGDQTLKPKLADDDDRMAMPYNPDDEDLD